MSRAALLLLLAAAAGAAPPLRSRKVDAAIEAVQPAVVKIYGVKGFRGVYGYMTGLIVSPTGLVITRSSVTLEEAPVISCHLHDGRRLPAELVRYDRRSRMALLQLKGEGAAAFPAATLGDSDTVRPGQFVLLVGNAYKVAQGTERCAVNLGVVSGVATLALRASTTEDFDYDRPVILHDAMNNPGVYGGPLVDLDGRVVGISGTIAESKTTNVQVHYAVPINDLKPFIDDTLLRPDAPKLYDRGGDDDDVDEAAAGHHGIRIFRAGINRATPPYVDQVLPGSPAARAGVRPDDLVLKIDRMAVKSWKSFERMMSRYRAGETVQLTLKRGDEVLVVAIKLEAKP